MASTNCNHCVHQLTIFFCSRCHCSLTSFRSLSNSFFLVRRGWKHKRAPSRCFKVRLTDVSKAYRACAYLHEFVVLEYGCGVEYQLAVFNVIFESSHVGFTERHKLLKWGNSGLHINHQHLKCSRDCNSANKTELFTHLLTRQCLGRFCYFCIALCTLNICKHTTPHVKKNASRNLYYHLITCHLWTEMYAKLYFVAPKYIGLLKYLQILLYLTYTETLVHPG